MMPAGTVSECVRQRWFSSPALFELYETTAGLKHFSLHQSSSFARTASVLLLFEDSGPEDQKYIPFSTRQQDMGIQASVSPLRMF